MGGGVPALYVVLQGKMAQDCLGYVTYGEIRQLTSFAVLCFQLTLSLMPAWTQCITCYSLDVMNLPLLKITGKSCILLLLLINSFSALIA